MKAFSILVASVTLSVGLFVGDVRGESAAEKKIVEQAAIERAEKAKKTAQDAREKANTLRAEADSETDSTLKQTKETAARKAETEADEKEQTAEVYAKLAKRLTEERKENSKSQLAARILQLQGDFDEVIEGLEGTDDHKAISNLNTKSTLQNLTKIDIINILELSGSDKSPMPGSTADGRKYFEKVAEALRKVVKSDFDSYKSIIDEVEKSTLRAISGVSAVNTSASLLRLQQEESDNEHNALNNGFTVVRYLIAHRRQIKSEGKEETDENLINGLKDDLNRIVIPALSKLVEDGNGITPNGVPRRRNTSTSTYSSFTSRGTGGSFEEIIRRSQERILRIKALRREYKAARKAIRDLD